MHFSQTQNGNGSRLTKIGIVTALHLAVGIALVNNMNTIKSGPAQPDDLDVVMIRPKVIEPPPPPPEPPKQVQKRTELPPRPTVAPPEVPVQPTEALPSIQPVLATEITPPATGPVTPVEVPARPAADTGAMRTAVLAEGCAKPDYPARAARNGETGTVSLALLVGSDGRVADTRLQKSSGSRELDRAAIAALSMCKFKPATQGGVSEPGWAQIAYVWTLES
jgi:protein TonB